MLILKLRPLHAFVFLAAVSATPFAQTPQAPRDLVATSATKSAVALAWTSPDPSVTTFVVERKPLGASWTPPAPPAVSPIVTTPVTGATMTDKTVSQFATYVYRVHVAGPNNTLGPASNEITVGPPPVGFSSVLLQPEVQNFQQFAHGVSAALDANGDPAIAYLFIDPDNNADNSDSSLNFISWNRAKYRWNAPVKVAVTGDTETNTPRLGISLVSDATTGQFALAHMTGVREVHVELSDDGAVWKDVRVDTAPEGSEFGAPSVAIDKGRVFLVYVGESAAVVYRSGLLTDGPGKWTRAEGPRLPDTFDARRAGLQVAVDATGRPAVIYWLTGSSYNVTLALWRPEAKTVVKVADTNGEQSDATDARLAFSAQKAVIAFYALRDKSFFDNQHQIWTTSSSDNGATWGAPVPMPADGGSSVGTPVSLTIDSQGTPAITAWIDGGNNSGSKCGEPKLFRPNTAGAWTVCAPESKGSPTHGVIVPHALFAGNGKLYIAYKAEGTDGPIKPGLMLWRER